MVGFFVRTGLFFMLLAQAIYLWLVHLPVNTTRHQNATHPHLPTCTQDTADYNTLKNAETGPWTPEHVLQFSPLQRQTGTELWSQEAILEEKLWGIVENSNIHHQGRDRGLTGVVSENANESAPTNNLTPLNLLEMVDVQTRYWYINFNIPLSPKYQAVRLQQPIKIFCVWLRSRTFVAVLVMNINMSVPQCRSNRHQMWNTGASLYFILLLHVTTKNTSNDDQLLLNKSPTIARCHDKHWQIPFEPCSLHDNFRYLPLRLR